MAFFLPRGSRIATAAFTDVSSATEPPSRFFPPVAAGRSGRCKSPQLDIPKAPGRHTRRAAIPAPKERIDRQEPALSYSAEGSVAEKLHRQVAELEVLNTDLDRRVAERTAQRESANATLQNEINYRQQAEAALRNANLRLSELVIRDPLTGLFNRRYLDESLEREVARARRSGTPLGIMMIDIDHFKHINDTFGHSVGDAVLVGVGRCMQSMARVEDILCPYGGEEFVLVMTTASLDTIYERAERVREAVRRMSIEHDGRHIGTVTISIGIAIHPDRGETGPNAIPAADAALYRAKPSRRNRAILAGAVGD